MGRARLALEGLSVGDGFGNSIFVHGRPESLHRPRPLPQAPWRYTDDTVMARAAVRRRNEQAGRPGDAPGLVTVAELLPALTPEAQQTVEEWLGRLQDGAEDGADAYPRPLEDFPLPA
jgi:hypothetical protein